MNSCFSQGNKKFGIVSLLCYVMSSHSSTFTFIHKAMIVMMAQGKRVMHSSMKFSGHQLLICQCIIASSHIQCTHKNAPVCLLYECQKFVQNLFFSLLTRHISSARLIERPFFTTCPFDGGFFTIYYYTQARVTIQPLFLDDYWFDSGLWNILVVNKSFKM